ncbi:IDEAL domain-containing protein [Virgibacillus sp. NKC19-3]|uniref:IDEAL domain-containing protein n=1 Tax=Virgibacillus saliphilus TaxID=2831674 RepID=UPI001C9A9452|nr:IDEAL domain-containing protein [Virgibacillus sp. NKC19-3]MBY7143022.1 IDEAL domain-containing protein [Virgibacillus sp. NKC19-3]
MKKEKRLLRYYRYEGEILKARKEIPFEFKLTARMMLDEQCFIWNKEKLEKAINNAIETGNKQEFINLSELFKQYVWE